MIVVTDHDGYCYKLLTNHPSYIIQHSSSVIHHPRLTFGNSQLRIPFISRHTVDLQSTVHWYVDVLKMFLFLETDSSAIIGYSPTGPCVELIQASTKVDRGSAFGRLAFSIDDIHTVYARVMAGDSNRVLHHPVVLKTPGMMDGV